MSDPDDKEFVSAEVAIAMLHVREGDLVHVFRNPEPNVLVGIELPLERITEMIRRAEPNIEVSGQNAQEMGHGLVIFGRILGALFIETRPHDAKEH